MSVDALKYNAWVDKKHLIKDSVDTLPDPLLDELLDFINFLKTKFNRSKIDSALLSQPLLAQDWDSPEDDEAWVNL